MKQVEVRIMGQNYLLGCADGAEQELLEAVKLVNKEMCEIRDAGKLKARERIAVLASLNIALLLAEKKQHKEAGKNNSSIASENLPDETKAQCEDMIYRIDAVLAQDGRLL